MEKTWKLVVCGTIALGLGGSAIAISKTLDNTSAAAVSPKASTFAKVDDLAQQIELLSKRNRDVLDTKADFNEDTQARLQREASTLAVVAHTLALHEGDHKLKAAAPEIVVLSQQLVEHASSEDTYDEALAAAEQIKKLVDGTATPGSPTDSNAANSDASATEPGWQRVGAQDLLMKQVQLTIDQLQRGMDARRFKRQAKENAGLATTLAVIGHATVLDNDYASGSEEEWHKFAETMRQQGFELAQLIHAGKLEESTAMVEAINNNCNACHKAFSVEH